MFPFSIAWPRFRYLVSTCGQWLPYWTVQIKNTAITTESSSGQCFATIQQDQIWISGDSLTLSSCRFCHGTWSFLVLPCLFHPESPTHCVCVDTHIQRHIYWYSNKADTSNRDHNKFCESPRKSQPASPVLLSRPHLLVR